MLNAYNSFVLDSEKEQGMIEFNEVSESYVGKTIEESKPTSCQTDPILPKFIKMFKL